MKYNKWDHIQQKLVEMDTDTDGLYNIWCYEFSARFDPCADEIVEDQGWELIAATDTKEEIHENFFKWKDYKITFNGQEITSRE